MVLSHDFVEAESEINESLYLSREQLFTPSTRAQAKGAIYKVRFTKKCAL